MHQGLSEEGLKPDIGHVLFSISKLICYTSLKQAPVGILQFCDTFIFLTHQKRQCVTQDLMKELNHFELFVICKFSLFQNSQKCV